jgi:type IV secretion system protein TrbL
MQSMDWTDCLINPVSCVVGSFGETAANSAWNSFLDWMASGLSDMSGTVFQRFSTSTSPRFDQQWWKDNLDLMIGVSLPILVAVFVLQCVSAVIRREPGRLGHAALGALLGTAGVPLAVGVISTCGKVVDEISLGILGTDATSAGLKRMTDIASVWTVASLGGFLLLAVELGLLAMFSLYFVMVVREVALLAFVVFAPVAMASWTWSATRHWLRRWVEIVGALLFSKIAMAVVFTLGISAFGASGQGNASNLGTFIAGILLIAMAAFTPLVTYTFIHWAGDQGHAATRVLQQGASGIEAGKEQLERLQQWGAEHFGGADSDDASPVVGNDQNADAGSKSDESDDASEHISSPTGGQESTEDADPAPQPAPPPPGADGDTEPTAIAVATSEVRVDGEASGSADDTSRASEREK